MDTGNITSFLTPDEKIPAYLKLTQAKYERKSYFIEQVKSLSVQPHGESPL
jgi:hypothetical protein